MDINRNLHNIRYILDKLTDIRGNDNNSENENPIKPNS